MAKNPADPPPLDSDSGLETAVAALKQIRKLLKKKFPDGPRWPAYIANSLLAGYAQQELPLYGKETP